MILSVPRIFLIATLFLALVLGYDVRQPPTQERRQFVQQILAAPLVVAGPPAWAVDVKVSPLAHTFVTTSGSPKPIRENDATRLCTNAKVVLLWQSEKDASNLASELVSLTVQRKNGQGAGVTPGKVAVASSNPTVLAQASNLGLTTTKTTSTSLDKAVIQAAQALGDGDVLLVGPLVSQGVAGNGQAAAELATKLGSFVGTKTGGGVASILVDGPTQGLTMESQGYPVSDLLWYSI